MFIILFYKIKKTMSIYRGKKARNIFITEGSVKYKDKINNFGLD